MVPVPGTLVELLAPPDGPVKLYHEIEAEFAARGEPAPPGVRMMAAWERDLLARTAHRKGRRHMRPVGR